MSNQQAPRMRLGGGGRSLTGEKADHVGKTVHRLLRYLTPYWVSISLIAALSVVGTLGRLAGPILIGMALDDYISIGDLDGLLMIVILSAVVYIISGIAGIVQGRMMVKVGQGFVAGLRSHLFNHIQTLSMAYHDHHPAGDLMSRVSNDTEAINQAISNGLIEFTSNVLLLGGIMVAMFALNWQLALGTAILLPLMVGITVWVTQYSRKAFREVQTHLGDLNSVMEENIAGIRVVKAFAHEEATHQQFLSANEDYKRAGTRADLITAALGPMFTTMNIFVIAAVALLGGWLALQDLVHVGVIATFVIYVRNFFQPMRGIAMFYNQLQASLAGAERIFVVLDAVPSVKDQPGSQPLLQVQGAVKFEDVSFEYVPDKPVLMDVNIDVQPGQTIALVGPTGAGKTTIISLLSRFYDVTQGTISIDGRDIRTVQQASIREQLGIVLQNTFLFSGTIMDNIRYGRLDATDEEVIAAAKLANADRFIQLLPQGYQAVVSEQGHNFSHGQRQLLAIARAILANPRILILDEATSSVDTRTEVYIQEALLRLLEGRTAFVIAHRLSTIRNADLVLVINDHRIIERGNHDELLAMQGFYYNLYMSQFSRLHSPLIASD